MNPSLAFFIMLNNYLHDIATALLMASGVAVWLVTNEAASAANPRIRAFVQDIYRGMTRITFFVLIWISLSAIPRILAFTRLEWPSAYDKGQIPGLIAKHVLAFIIIVSGSFLWISISRAMRSVSAAKAPETENP